MGYVWKKRWRREENIGGRKKIGGKCVKRDEEGKEKEKENLGGIRGK